MEFKIGKKKTKDYTVIIGCGRLGASLAGTLSDEDRNVLIEKNPFANFLHPLED